LREDYWETAKPTLPIILKLLLISQYQLLGKDYWETGGDALRFYESKLYKKIMETSSKNLG